VRISIAGASATDISGTWTLAVFPGDKPINNTFVFKQEGAKLSGTYSGPYGESQVSGAMKGDNVVFGFKVKDPGSKGVAIVTFNGAVESPTKMTGSVGNPFCGDNGCKWIATKKK
jgi:hypothetical protein